MDSSTPNEYTWLLSNKFTSSSRGFPLTIVSSSVRPYVELIRLEKPTGIALMFWPFAWSLTMSAFRTGVNPTAYSAQLFKCYIAAFIVRSSACTVNDIVDRDMDMGVERTRNRPLPSGRVSVSSALIFLFVQYTVGLVFFYLAFPGLAFSIYPFLKRFTHWPQAWLGIAMNFGIITAWTSSGDAFNTPLITSAMAGCWCWTMLYDTIYACQDIEDDVKVGVRSTAILFGTWIRPLLIGCGLAFLTMLLISGILNGQGTVYFVVSVGGTSCHLLWQYKTVDLRSPQSCWTNFQRNGHLGWIVWGGLIVDYLRSVCVSV
ncbi:hypothetical protein HYPSUDRAFT_137304 [Hypholoma sublateritium FD-334 SS-4]|uniref:4-hydroxybenzoate polyprenyltransferase, mitochondrial n=1 Tax=Hypholoma sublateritium (strain FD-334 SS-4) TaxID=945553 RepID=A0A0D2PW99_HYPSF|nr:hypothetical protein HYPSUDRAFT_137304 [Hypholoma sublateritium FD-334 SS-4]